MAASASTPAAAPWRPLFLTHISQMESPEFVLGSLGASGAPASAPLPRARFCVFRGMWAELPPNDRNPAPRNASVYASDLLTLTTDARMHKIPELFASAPGSRAAGVDGLGSGLGGPVEAVFWAKPVMTQWRFKGRTYIVGPDIDDPESARAAAVRRDVQARVRLAQAADGEKDWSWSTELTAHFGNLSPGMRGSFQNPPPGTPVSESLPDPSLKLGGKVEDLHDPIARHNFRVVIICPEEVELVDLSDPERARRWRYTYVGDKNSDGEVIAGWKKEELWP